jgi:hypothetical protein
LREYEAIVPGAANRLLKLTEFAEQERIQREMIVARLAAMFKVEMAIYVWMTYVPLALLLVAAIFTWASMGPASRGVLLFGTLTLSSVSLARQLLFKRKLRLILDQLDDELGEASTSRPLDSRNASTAKL